MSTINNLMINDKVIYPAVVAFNNLT